MFGFDLWQLKIVKEVVIQIKYFYLDIQLQVLFIFQLKILRCIWRYINDNVIYRLLLIYVFF